MKGVETRVLNTSVPETGLDSFTNKDYITFEACREALRHTT